MMQVGTNAVSRWLANLMQYIDELKLETSSCRLMFNQALSELHNPFLGTLHD